MSGRSSRVMPTAYREPLCPSGALPRTERRPRRFSRHYPAFIAPMGSCAEPHPSHVLWFPLHAGPCRLLRAPAGKWPLPVLSPQSLHRRLDPYPAALLRCSCPFLPEGLRPHLNGDRFGAPDNRRNATSTTDGFRGCSHSFMFRLPCLLDPPVAPTTEAQCPQGGRAVYATQWTRGHPRELWYRYVPDPGNWHGRTFTCWTAALPAATHPPVSLLLPCPCPCPCPVLFFLFQIKNLQRPASGPRSMRFA